MTNSYQMNYKAPIAENWTHHPLSAPETADEVSSMLERLKAESISLESYFTDLESELKRVHLKRKVVGKKLGVLQELVKEVEALRAEPVGAVPSAVPVPRLEAHRPVAADARQSRTKKMLCAASVALVVLAIAVIALEKTGQIPSCLTCAPARLLGLM